MPKDLDLERARRGDLDAFRRLVDTHSRVAYRLAYKLVRDEGDADDVVQDAFLEAWRKLPGFEGKASFRTWLFRITSNCAYDLLRKRARFEERETPLEGALESMVLVETEASPEHRVQVRRDLARELGKAFQTLTESERDAFVLRHLEQRPVAEIGELLGLKRNTAKQAIFRAVRKVREQLQPLMEGQP